MAYKDPGGKKAYDAAWRAAHREEVQAYAKAYRMVHRKELNAQQVARATAQPEKQTASQLAWRLTHPGYMKDYAATHREEQRAKSARYKQSHRDEVRVTNARCRARKKDLPATLTAGQWQAIKATYRHRCAYCGKKESKRCPLTQDHVIPLKKDGGYIMGNIVPACQSCNSKKRTGPPPKPVKLVLL